MNSRVEKLPLMAPDGRTGDNSGLSRQTRPFFVGEENSLVRVLVDSGIRRAPAYNPIVLYGPSGVGKSHLLRGYADRYQLLVPRRKPCVLTGSDFARLYASAIELDALSELRERWNSAGLIAIDCLDELRTKLAAQQELVLLIDSCVERECPFVGACSSPVDDWNWMIPTLHSRLTGGLTIPVVPPETATRYEMIRQLAKAHNLSLSDSAVARLANPPVGHQHRLDTFPGLQGFMLNLAYEGNDETGEGAIDRSLGEKDASPNGAQRQTRRIAKLVARHFDLKQSDLTGSSRRKTVVHARGIAIYLARSVLGTSFEQLGRTFGNRDHTTILHAYRKLDGLLRVDPRLKQTVDKLKQQIALAEA